MSIIRHQSTLVMVPAYNAGNYLEELLPRIRKFTCDSNLLFVNDGSTDNTEEFLNKLDVPHITFEKNQGKGAALLCAFDYAVKNEYRSILALDCDLQHLPEDIPAFYALDDGNTVIIGTRSITLAEMPFARWLSNNLTSLLVSVFSSGRVRDSQSGFRLIPTSLLGALDLKTTGYDLESEILFKAGVAGCSVAEVPISTIYEGSVSYINPLSDTGRFIRQVWKRIWA